MSGRNISTDFADALGLDHVNVGLFVEMQFVGGTVRVSNLAIDTPWNGHTWLALGRLGSVDAIDEGAAIQGRDVAFILSGVDPALTALAQTENVKNRLIKTWLGVFGPDNQVVVDPVLVYRGRMNYLTIVEDKVATIKLATHGRLADFERSRVRRYNDEDHQAVNPGDLYFQYVSQMVEKPLRWGVPN